LKTAPISVVQAQGLASIAKNCWPIEYSFPIVIQFKAEMYSNYTGPNASLRVSDIEPEVAYFKAH